jgi:hypothetical protein
MPLQIIHQALEVEALGEKMDEYIEAQRRATGFDVRYAASAVPQDRDWLDCAVVLSRRDLTTLLSMAWGT